VDFLIFFSISTKKYWIFTNILIEILVPNPICLHFVLQTWLQNGQKVWEIQIFSKSPDKNLDDLEKSWESQFISMISISLDDLDKSLTTQPSLDCKSLNSKNLDREKKLLISTCRTFSTIFKS
jgi:hypothetical protein